MSLFDAIKQTRAVYFDGYIAFDDKLPLQYKYLMKTTKEVDMKVFETKELTLDFIETYSTTKFISYLIQYN